MMSSVYKGIVIGLLCGLGTQALANGMDYKDVNDVPMKSESELDELPEVVQHVLDIHPVIASRQAFLDVSYHAIKEQQAGFFPALDLAVGRGVEWSNNSTIRAAGYKDKYDDLFREENSLSLVQNVFNGFATIYSTKAAKHRYNNANYQLMDGGEVIGLQATEAYLDVMRQRALVDIAQGSVDAHKRFLKMIEQRESAGYDRRADVYQVQTRLSLANTRLVTQEGSLADAISSYIEIVNEHPGGLKRPRFEGGLIPLEVSDAIAEAMESNPSVNAATEATQANKDQINVTTAPFLPNLNIEVSASQNNNLDGVRDENNDILTMARLQYNLFRGGADLARRRQAVYTHQQSIADEAETRRIVRESIRFSYNAIEEAQNQINYERDHVKSAEQLVESYKGQFEIGTRSLLALLDAEDERFVAASNLANQEYILLFEQYRLLANLGRLLDSLEVEFHQEVL